MNTDNILARVREQKNGWEHCFKIFYLSLQNWLQGMFDSATYNTMFEELLKSAVETGPFDRAWSNVPVVKDHALQVLLVWFFLNDIKLGIIYLL